MSGKSRTKTVAKTAAAILEGRFDLTRNEDVKEMLDTVGFDGYDEDGKTAVLESAIIAVHARYGLLGDLKSAQWVFDLACKSDSGRKLKLEVRELELRVKQMQKQLKEQETADRKPETGPEVSEAEISESLSRLGVIDD